MHTDILPICVNGEMSESAEGARLLSEYTSLNLYRGFKSLSLRHQESNSSLCMTLIVCKDCFFIPSSVCNPLAFSLCSPCIPRFLRYFFRYFLFWGEADRSVQRPQKRYCTGVLHNGLTSNFDSSIREQGRGLRVSKTGRLPSPRFIPASRQGHTGHAVSRETAWPEESASGSQTRSSDTRQSCLLLATSSYFTHHTGWNDFIRL